MSALCSYYLGSFRCRRVARGCAPNGAPSCCQVHPGEAPARGKNPDEEIQALARAVKLSPQDARAWSRFLTALDRRGLAAAVTTRMGGTALVVGLHPDGVLIGMDETHQDVPLNATMAAHAMRVVRSRFGNPLGKREQAALRAQAAALGLAAFKHAPGEMRGWIEGQSHAHTQIAREYAAPPRKLSLAQAEALAAHARAVQAGSFAAEQAFQQTIQQRQNPLLALVGVGNPARRGNPDAEIRALARSCALDPSDRSSCERLARELWRRQDLYGLLALATQTNDYRLAYSVAAFVAERHPGQAHFGVDDGLWTKAVNAEQDIYKKLLREGRDMEVPYGHARFRQNPLPAWVVPGAVGFGLGGMSALPVGIVYGRVTGTAAHIARAYRGAIDTAKAVREAAVAARDAARTGSAWFKQGTANNPTDANKAGMDRHKAGDATLESARRQAQSTGRLAEFNRAVAAYTKFHGCAPKTVAVYRVPDGRKQVTREYGAALGRVPESRYHRTPAGSNKSGTYWIHKHPAGAEPLEVVIPRTGLTTKVGGSYRVSGEKWWFD